MKELSYSFDAEYIIKKKKSLKRQLLADVNRNFVEKRIAILGGETTENIKLTLELFLLNYGIKPYFYESEYNQYYEDGMFPNPLIVKVVVSKNLYSCFDRLSDIVLYLT